MVPSATTWVCSSRPGVDINTLLHRHMNTWQYALIERTPEGEIVQQIDVTEEIISMYKRIDLFQACSEASIKKILGDPMH